MNTTLRSIVPVFLLGAVLGCASTHQSPVTSTTAPPKAGADPGASTGRPVAQAAPAPSRPAAEPPARTTPTGGTEGTPRDADAADTPGTQVAGETTPDRTAHEELPSSVQPVRDQMEDAYQSGLEAWQAGRYDEAKGQFDRAVDVVLSSGIDISGYPGFKATFDQRVRDIADLDSELFSQEPAPGPGDSGSPLDSLKDITTFLSTEEAEKERAKVQEVVEAITYDIPITLHPKVLAFVEAFTTRIRKEFESGLRRSGGYLPMVKKIFREEGLPLDLVYMAHQESAFKTNAYSRARAKGMWQFMSFTGRRYGLRIDPWVDERCDFEKSTRAAAAYLRDLYARYGDWYLAMAAYNAGEGKIDRAIARSRSRDFWTIAKTRYIRAETKSYVPAILASILIDKSPADYGFDTTLDAPLAWETVIIDKATDLAILAEGANTTLELIRLLNPELRGLVTPPNLPTYPLRVPTGSGEALVAHLAGLPDDKRVSWTVHETRSGETFTTVARRYKVPTRALIEANPRYAGKRLNRGTLLNVPLVGGAVVPAVVTAAADRPSYESGERIVHRVRSGDTLHAVAAKYRTTVPNLKRWNNLGSTTIRPGQRLVAYYGERGAGPAIDADATVSVAAGRTEYRVQPGDSLSSISRRFGAALDDLCRWNNLERNAVIKPGDRLMVGEPRPEPATAGTVAVPHAPAPAAAAGSGGHGAAEGGLRHKVKRGDTLTGIARLYDVSVQQVRVWNGLGREGLIYPGQVLRIESR